jgi:hypothetical protein
MSVTDLSVASTSFEVGFGAERSEIGGNGATLMLATPWLGGARGERLLPGARAAGTSHGFSLWEADGLLMGASVQPVGGSLRRTTRELYTRLFRTSVGWPLYRVWNYVPGINAVVDGRENYHRFCEGRAEAFEALHGSGFKRALPAASAVGCGGDALAVVFIAGRKLPQHLENPEQVPAYEYPREHGPRPPSFSRATMAKTESGRRLVFVSGTAAIKGHATVAPGDLGAQLDCTLDNLRLISRAALLGDALGGESTVARHFKVYLRDPATYRTVRDRLEAEWVQPSDHVVYLQADVCRAALEVEIEATLIER